MAFQLFYNDLFPLRMINFAKKYLDVGGSISFDNRSVIQLSKLQVIDSFFPGLFVKAINEEKEAEYDYDTCYILAPRKMGVLSNWGPYKQKINGIEDCLLGNRRSETGYKNYLAARNMIRRAAVDLAADEGLFHFLFSHLTQMHECLNEEQKKSLDAWMLKTLTVCGREKTVRFCTQERPDGFSFERKIYLDILSRMNVFAKNRDFRSLFAWLCLVCLLGNSSEKLLKKYAGTKPDTLPKDEPAYELIPSPGVIGVPGFCGRDDILAEIDQLFSRGNRVVCLSGISGIGKTETAKQYAAECRAQYDCMIYAVYNGSLRDLVISEMPFEIRPSVKRLNEGSSKESAESYFRRKLDIIKKASDEKTLIILDNYNTEYDEDLDVFLNGRYRVLITTQYDYSARFASISVGPVHDEEALKTIFMNNYRGYTVQKDDPDLDELIKAANGHTYTIVLLAHHMEYSGQTAREMLEALREKGIVSINEKLFETDGQTDEAYHRLVRMFPLFEFTEEEQTVLQLLSLISGAPVPAMVFRKWAELSSMKSILNLESRGWIMRQPDGIILHSVIGSVMRHVLPFKADQIQFFLDHAAEEIANENSWGWTKKQKEQYCSICRSVLTYVNEINTYTAGFIQAAAVLLGYGGYPAQALKLDEKLAPGEFRRLADEEIKALMADLDSSKRYEVSDKVVNEKVPAGKYMIMIGGGYLTNKENDTDFKITPYNDSSNDTTFPDAKLGSVTISDAYDEDEQAILEKIEFYGGIHLGSTRKELTKVFGEPTDEREYDNYKGGKYQKLEFEAKTWKKFEFQIEDGKVTEMSWTNYGKLNR